MQTEKQLQRAADARLRQARHALKELDARLAELQERHGIGPMAAARDLAQDIIQCVHEYNAYANARLT